MTVLTDMESELKVALTIQDYNWIEIAKKLIQIRAQNIWRESGLPSWTNWLKQLGEKTRRHPETYFKMIAAYNYYQELRKNCNALKDIEDAELSKDSIMSVKTISRDLPDIGTRLMLDVISGRYKRRHLKIMNRHIGAAWDTPQIQACLLRAEVVCLLLRRAFFGGKEAKKFYCKVGIRDRLNFDCIAVSNDPSPVLHGVVVCETSIDLQNHANHVDHLWVATTSKDLNGDTFGLIHVDLESDDYEILKTPQDKGRASRRSQTMECLLTHKEG